MLIGKNLRITAGTEYEVKEVISCIKKYYNL